jgi:hypothetical protein
MEKLSKLQFWQAIAQASELLFPVVFHTENCAVHPGKPTVSSVYLPTSHHTWLHFLFVRKSVYMLGNSHRLLWQWKHVPECRMTQNKEHIIFPECSDRHRAHTKFDVHLGSSLGVKSLKCEADHLTPSGPELRMAGTIPPLPHTPSQPDSESFCIIWISAVLPLGSLTHNKIIT